MLIGTDKVIESFKMSGKPQWKLYYNVTKAATNALTNESDPSGDNGTNADRLEQVLAMLAPGKYMIQFKKGLDDNTGFTQTLFTIPGEVTTPATPAAIGNPYAAMGNVMQQQTFETLLQAKIDAVNEKHRREMVEAQAAKDREELAELRKNDGAIGNFFNNWAPLLLQVFAFKQGVPVQPGAQVGMAGFGPQQQSVPTHEVNQPVQTENTTQAEENPDDTQQKLNEVLAWLTQTEGSPQAAVQLLYTMKVKAQQNPQLLGMLKQFLAN